MKWNTVELQQFHMQNLIRITLSELMIIAVIHNRIAWQ